MNYSPLNDLAWDLHQEAKQNGWYDTPRSALEIHMLIVSEIAEATEEVRKGRPLAYKAAAAHEVNGESIPTSLIIPIDPAWAEQGIDKPEGEMVELVDALIRILDYCASKSFDIDSMVQMKRDYNKTRGWRHGGKKY